MVCVMHCMLYCRKDAVYGHHITHVDTLTHTYTYTRIHISFLSTFKWERSEREIKRQTLRVTVKVWSVRAVLEGEEDT
jgi:hypothetical protein